MKHNYLIFLFILLLFGCSANDDIRDGLSYDEYVKIARRHASVGEPEKAIIAYKKALNINQNDANIHYTLGRLYSSEEQRSYKDATSKCQLNMLSNTGQNKNINLEKELKKMGYKSEYNLLALKEYIQTVKIDPNHWSALYFIATDHKNNKRYVEAINEYKKIISINPKLHLAYNQIADAYLEIGYCKQALDNYGYAFKLSNDTEYYYFNAGRVFIKMGDAEKTTEMINKSRGSTYYNDLTGYQFEPRGKCLTRGN